MQRCATEASASIQVNPLHMNVSKITCTVQGPWLYKSCPEECMCKILYLALWHFSPKWHDALSTTWVDGCFLFRVQRCWASCKVTVRASFANSEKQHEWLVKITVIFQSMALYLAIPILCSTSPAFELLWWQNTSLYFTYVFCSYWEIMSYFSAKSLFYKEKNSINIDRSRDTVNCLYRTCHFVFLLPLAITLNKREKTKGIYWPVDLSQQRSHKYILTIGNW